MVSRLKAVAMAAMVLGARAAQAADPVAADGSTFCERLAVPLGMHVSVEEADGALPDHPVYRMSQLTLGMALVGGSSAVKIGVEPITETSLADYKAAQSKCEMVKKGAACHLDGPLRLHVETKKRKAEVETRPGERAEVWTSGLEVRCRDV